VRIAQIAPLFESVPPRLYGGTERVVSYLTEELVRAGHDVTLFASGDSRTSARLVPCCDEALRLAETPYPVPHGVRQLELVRRQAAQFDVLHFHVDLLHMPLLRTIGVPSVTTLHGRLDMPDLAPFYTTFDDVPLVSISRSQRRPMPPVHWVGTVHHGLPPDLLTPQRGRSRDYLAFIGRISPEKRPDRAIEIARRAGMPLRMAAKVDPADRAYWRDVIEPMIRDDPQIEFLGEVGDAAKAEFLGGAAALLFPIDWPEPFGMVMIEAFACGTPVIAMPCGSVAEVVDHGMTGFIVDSVDAAVAAVPAARRLDPEMIRATFLRRFSAERMATDYVAIYETLRAGAVGGRYPAGAPKAVNDIVERLGLQA
jgi:glycosyltransferase involved in cell wall biosynthesis